MNTVQPIRDPQKIKLIKQNLRRRNSRDWFLFIMGINTGLRISDLLPLRVRDVRNQTHIVIKEKKTGKTKRFPINYSLKELIESYTFDMQDYDFLFPSHKTDLPIQRGQAYKILNQAASEAGLTEIGTHTMRKTFGYFYYKQTKDVAMLQKIFGHSAPSITLRYIGIEQEQIDESLFNFSL
ncbi:site-specific integrase [Guptibacillus hwajinpoensis]|uniref:Integrase n=1 Tax=Guptibacillus hwajinpoensis TaxID=208199 RepID=A0ABU0K1G6_9BACL|nr:MULTISPECIES: site-specific integrase [Alkalihalobacillus]MDP4549984.1 site-specific integrase [Alkalihalobacillus macyae]MDQ0483195.1 integrase [Alkalihalobacillus hemicentroti]